MCQSRTVAGMPAFCHDAKPEVIWECSGFDEPWNGWASPIVDWETLIDVLDDAGWYYRTEGAVFRVSPDEDALADEVIPLVPDEKAQYHLRELGWTFLKATSHETTILPFIRPGTKS